MKFTLSWLKTHLDTEATLAEITDTLTRIGLELEGVEDPTAGLIGEVAIAVFKNSFERWVSSSEPSDLAQVMRDSFEQLRAVTSST